MLDLARIVGFDWDEGNARKSADKHGVSQAEASRFLPILPLAILEDLAHSRSEPRFQALGRTGDHRHLHVTFTFTLRAEGTRIRVISARDMNRKEQARYEEEA